MSASCSGVSSKSSASPEGGCEEDGVTVLHEGMTECAGGVGLSGAWQAEAEHVGCTLEEVPALELAESGQHTFGEALRVERLERLRSRQMRGPQEALTSAHAALAELGFERFAQDF